MADRQFSLAQAFADYAANRLADIGFNVDQILRGGPYDASAVRFRTDNDLYLSVSFSPYDRGDAYTSFGRMWESDDGWRKISNYLNAYSGLTGLEFPEFHKLAASYEYLPETYESILGDLENVLPTILRSVTSSDFDEIEAGQFGAVRLARDRYGDKYIDKIHCNKRDNA